MDEMRAMKAIYVYSNHNLCGHKQSAGGTAGDAFSAFSPAGAQQRAEEEKLVSSTRRPNPRGNLIFKDVTSDGDDCDSHVDEGEQDEEGKDASGEAHERDKRQRRSRGVRMCVSWSVPDAEQRLQGCRSSSMTGQLAAQRVHVLWEKYWLAAWQDE